MKSPHKKGQHLINHDFSGTLDEVIARELAARVEGRYAFDYSVARDGVRSEGDRRNWCRSCGGYYGVMHEKTDNHGGRSTCGPHGSYSRNCACMACTVGRTYDWVHYGTRFWL